MKIHLHDEQFDGVPHPWCGRGKAAVVSDVFEAADPSARCQRCAREWFPGGQPEWHLQGARHRVARRVVRRLSHTDTAA
jgi:hypothetical protein